MADQNRPGLLEELKNLLQQDDRLTADGNLLKNVIVEHALKLEKDLIRLLLSKSQIKDHFFADIDGTLVFDKDKFISFVDNKQFLPDSYTSFKNKIGLTLDGRDDYLKERKDVVLVWPYKDCVLEGGQTKEDQKRDEIFWNETLAADEIDRLFEPKVLTNFKRFDKGGEHKVSEIKDTDNLIIKGNNLLALYTLKKKFAGKVKLIYIDPPYNTGGAEDIFTYNNDFDHSTWMTFMKNRLEVAKDFLRNDGFIAITIDHVELFYLGALADEVFGRNNRVGIVTIYINPKGRQHEKFFSAATEHMLVYSKNISVAEFNKVTLDEERAQVFNLSDDKGKYRLDKFIRARMSTLRKEKPTFWYPVYVSRDLRDITLKKKVGYYEIYPIQNGKEFTWKTVPETFNERNKDGYFVAKKENGEVNIYHKYYEQQVLKNIWLDKKYFPEFQGTQLLKKLLGASLFSYPKSLYAVVDTLKIMTSNEDIIMDFFAGSGTTGHAVLELNKEDGGNRKFILVEQLDEHIEICKKRIQKALQNYSKEDENSIFQERKDSYSFLYCELMKWNEAYIDKIQKARTKADLAKIWAVMKEKAHISYKIDLKEFDKQAAYFEQLSFENQRKFLLEVLDKNQLYVNYCEIDDTDYKVSTEDKKLNRIFYGG